MRIALKTSGAMVVGGEVEEFKQAVLNAQKEFAFRVEIYWDMRFQGVYRSLHNNQAW